MDYDKLKAQLEIDEGIRRRRYLDTANPPRWTIGMGHNISDDPHYPFTEQDEPLSDDKIDFLSDEDIDHAISDLDQNVNWWRAMEEPRQRVLANMCFNMGWPTLSTFNNTLNAMHIGDYVTAASNMRASKWYGQVGARGQRLAKIMETGED